MNRRFLLLVGILTAALPALPRPAAAQAVLRRCERLLSDAELLAKNVAECDKALGSLVVKPTPIDPAVVKARAAAAEKAAQEARAAEAAKEAERLKQAQAQREKLVPEGSATIKEVMISTGVVPQEIGEALTANDEMTRALVARYAVGAFEAGQIGLCDPLEDNIVGWIHETKACRLEYRAMAFLRSVGGSPAEFSRVCGQDMGREFFDVNRAKLGNFCAAMARELANPAAACPELVGYLREPLPVSACTNYLSGKCEDMDPVDAVNCRDLANFRRAAKARDVSQCGASVRCRVAMGASKQVLSELAPKLRAPAAQWVLSGGPKPQTRQVAAQHLLVLLPSTSAAATVPPEPSRTPVPPSASGPAATKIDALKFMGFVCEPPLHSEENRKAISGVFSAAQLCLKDVETAMSEVDLATAKAIDARSERLARLQVQIDATFEPSGAPPARKRKK